MTFYKKLLFIVVSVGSQAHLCAMDYSTDAENIAITVPFDILGKWQKPTAKNYVPLLTGMLTSFDKAKAAAKGLTLVTDIDALKKVGMEIKKEQTGMANIVHGVFGKIKQDKGTDLSVLEDDVVNVSTTVIAQPEFYNVLAQYKNEIPLYSIAMDQDTKEAAIWSEQLKKQGYDLDSLCVGKLTHKAYCDVLTTENEDYGTLSKTHFVSKRLKTHPGFYKAIQALTSKVKKIYFVAADQNRLAIAEREIKNLEGILARDATELKVALAEIKRKQEPIKYDELD